MVFHVDRLLNLGSLIKGYVLQFVRNVNGPKGQADSKKNAKKTYSRRC